MLRLRCHYCHAAIPMTAARLAGSIILCARCHGHLSQCPETNCDGRLLKIEDGPHIGDRECSECEETYEVQLLASRASWPATPRSEKVIQFPSRTSLDN